MTRSISTAPIRQDAASDRVVYPLPWWIGIELVWSAVWGKKRTFSNDARACLSLLHPPVEILGGENIPQQGPCLISANHYSRPGFRAWWIALAISACLPVEVHWVMTDAWRFEGRPFASQLEALTRWGFKHAAQVYGFSRMPPMPPRDEETLLRAQAVRQLLSYTRRDPCPVIGLIPEGYDLPGGLLGVPPSGSGRLIARLIAYTQCILPAAIFEAHAHLCLNFGEPITIHIPKESKPETIDQLVIAEVMRAIANLLPSDLRGAYQ